MNSAFPLWWQSFSSCCLDHHFLFSRTLPHLALPSSCCLGSFRRGLAFIIVSFFSVVGLHYVAQAGLKLGTVFLSYSPKCWNYRWEPPFPPWVLFFFKRLYLCVCVVFSVCIYSRMWQRTEEGVGSLGPEITGSCEPPDNGAGDQILVLSKNSKHS